MMATMHAKMKVVTVLWLQRMQSESSYSMMATMHAKMKVVTV